MLKYKRWSHNKIYDLLQQNHFIGSSELEFWLMKDYTDAQILRWSSCKPNEKRTIKRGLYFIKRNLINLKAFKNMKTKIINGGIQIES